MSRVQLREEIDTVVGHLLGVIDGATVNVYLAGTSTPATIYQAETGGATYSQPLTSVSGRVEAAGFPGEPLWVEEADLDVSGTFVPLNGGDPVTFGPIRVGAVSARTLLSVGRRAPVRLSDYGTTQAALDSAAADAVTYKRSLEVDADVQLSSVWTPPAGLPTLYGRGGKIIAPAVASLASVLRVRYPGLVLEQGLELQNLNPQSCLVVDLGPATADAVTAPIEDFRATAVRVTASPRAQAWALKHKGVHRITLQDLYCERVNYGVFTESWTLTGSDANDLESVTIRGFRGRNIYADGISFNHPGVQFDGITGFDIDGPDVRGFAYSGTLFADITSGATSLTLTSALNADGVTIPPSGVISLGQEGVGGGLEYIAYTALNTSGANPVLSGLTRGYAGTAQAWTAGAAVRYGSNAVGYGVAFAGSYSGTLRGARIRGFRSRGLHIEDQSERINASDLLIEGCAGGPQSQYHGLGIYLLDCRYLNLHDFTVKGSEHDGMRWIYDTAANLSVGDTDAWVKQSTIHHGILAENGGMGARFGGSIVEGYADTQVDHLQAIANTSHGFAVEGNPMGLTLDHLRAAFNGGRPVLFDASMNPDISNLESIENVSALPGLTGVGNSSGVAFHNPRGRILSTFTGIGFSPSIFPFNLGKSARGVLTLHARVMPNALGVDSTQAVRRSWDVTYDGTTLTATAIGSHQGSSGFTFAAPAVGSGDLFQTQVFLTGAPVGTPVALTWRLQGTTHRMS